MLSRIFSAGSRAAVKSRVGHLAGLPCATAYTKPHFPLTALRSLSVSGMPTSTLENTKAAAVKPNNQVVLWKLYGTFNRHNTLLTFVAVVEDLNFMERCKDLTYTEKVLYYIQLPHQPKIHVSAGQLGFRKAQRSEYEAGYQVSARMFKLIEERGLLKPKDKVEMILKNFGRGRQAFLNALQGKEGSHVKNHIVRISDSTKLKFGGTRSKKLRRL